jgi:ribose transport system permease protein
VSTETERPTSSIEESTGWSSTEAPSRRIDATDLLERWAFPAFLLVVAVFFTFLPATSDTFPTAANLRTVATGSVIVAVVALAALIPLVCEEFDLSVGAVAGLSSILAAEFMAGGGNLVVAIVIAVVVGAFVGLLNAVLITVAGVNAVITTLGMSIIIAGAINQRTEGQAVTGNIPDVLREFGTETVWGIPKLAIALVAIAATVYYMLDHTPLGRRMYAYGSNQAAAALVGIRTKRLVATAFILAGVLAGLAGLLQVARSGGASPRVGDSLTLPALAAAFLSTASIKPGRYNVGGTMVAILFLSVLNSGLNLAGAESYVNSYVNGIALIVGVGLAVALGRNRHR